MKTSQERNQWPAEVSFQDHTLRMQRRVVAILADDRVDNDAVYPVSKVESARHAEDSQAIRSGPACLPDFLVRAMQWRMLTLRLHHDFTDDGRKLE